MAGVRGGARRPLKILAISGSLRAASSNSAILRVAARVAPRPITVDVYGALDTLPYFNPDHDREFNDPALPLAVKALRASIGSADALLISSPEYAHGVSGMLKNALDWLVGGPEMVEKPVAVINTSPHATHAIAALIETLRTMSVTLVDAACLTIAVPRNQGDDAIVEDASLATPLRDALLILAAAANVSSRSS
ncbi:MAG: NAD(P)H-dependent oxidoreductase [bacterium]